MAPDRPSGWLASHSLPLGPPSGGPDTHKGGRSCPRAPFSPGPSRPSCTTSPASAPPVVLSVRDQEGDEAEVYLRDGLVYAVMVPGRRTMLGVRLMSRGALTPEALAEALEIQRTELQGWRLGELLVHLGYVDLDVVEEFVVEHLKDALADLLGWPVASWKFRKNKKTRQDVAPPTPVDVLLDDLRDRRTTWETILSVIGGQDAVPALAAGSSSGEVEMGPNEWALLCKVDGQRSVADLAAECGFTLFEAGQVVMVLAESGMVSVTPGAAGLRRPMPDCRDARAGPSSRAVLPHRVEASAPMTDGPAARPSDRAGRSRAHRGRAGRSRAGRSRAGRSRARRGRARRSRARRSRTRRSRARREPSGPKADASRRSRARRSRARRSRAGRSRAVEPSRPKPRRSRTPKPRIEAETASEAERARSRRSKPSGEAERRAEQAPGRSRRAEAERVEAAERRVEAERVEAERARSGSSRRPKPSAPKPSAPSEPRRTRSPPKPPSAPKPSGASAEADASSRASRRPKPSGWPSA